MAIIVMRSCILTRAQHWCVIEIRVFFLLFPSFSSSVEPFIHTNECDSSITYIHKHIPHNTPHNSDHSNITHANDILTIFFLSLSFSGYVCVRVRSMCRYWSYGILQYTAAAVSSSMCLCVNKTFTITNYCFIYIHFVPFHSDLYYVRQIYNHIRFIDVS